MYQAEPDPYCYPGTDVLKNKAGLKSTAKLERFETAMTFARSEGPLPNGRLSAAHHCACKFSHVRAGLDVSYVLTHNNLYKEYYMDLKVPALEVAKHFGEFADKALAQPVHVTKHGRNHVVILSENEYARLKSRDRIVFRAEDTPAEILQALTRADDIPSEAKALNAEVEGWVW